MSVDIQSWQLRKASAPQTLRVWSWEPETIVFPSGEKATEVIQLLWAFAFSVTSSSVAASGQGESASKRTSGFGFNARLNSKL